MPSNTPKLVERKLLSDGMGLLLSAMAVNTTRYDSAVRHSL